MLTINLGNIEELLFYDKKVQKLLPEFSDLFGQWILAKQAPALRTMGKRAIINLLNGLEESHITILSRHFGQQVIVETLDYRIVKNCMFPLEEAERGLNTEGGFSNLALHRDGNHLYISSWR